MACLIVVSALASFQPLMSRAGNTYCRPRPTKGCYPRRPICPLQSHRLLALRTGNWVVGGREIHEGEVIVLNGNLTIKAGGNLTLVNRTLLINCTYDGELAIAVVGAAVAAIAIYHLRRRTRPTLA